MAITSKGAQPAPQEALQHIGHFVQFYQNDAFLLDALSEFIEASLKAGDACIMMITQAHREQLEARLQARGFDLTAISAAGGYLALDADETLSKFMGDDLPVPERFTDLVGGIITKAAQGHSHLRLYGEMVALLWARGKHAAALRLEELWNELSHKTHPFLLFCAYPMHTFAAKAYEEPFAEICQQHTQVFPDESFTFLPDPDEQRQAITLLQQKANALEVEIAERKKVEERLLHLAAIVESSDDAILSKDLEGIITSWNAGAERIYGYSAQEIVGQPITRLFLPHRQDEFTQIMERIRHGERVDHFETTRVRKDGMALTVSVTVSPVKNSNGTIIGASAIARDITEHKQLEAKFQSLLDSNLFGVFISDFAGTFLDANAAFLDLLGYTRAELQAGSMQRDALTPPELHSQSQQALAALQETGVSGAYEKEYLHKNGKRVSVLVAVARIGQSETCIGFVLDISERKELDKRKDEFISMASHELKTPVTSLKGFLSLLQRRMSAQGDEKALHYLNRMDTQVNKLTKLINDLLDLSKMQTGQLAYREERVEMDELVQEIMENVQETTQTHRLQLVGQSSALLLGDRDRIGQVLINLLTNAIKYSPQADRVLIHVARDNDRALVSVQDFGIGIADEYQQKIFERFYQVTDAEEKTFPGLGIGLYISHEIVRRHGGQMWVESAKGKGATFHVSLPLLEEMKGSASL
ncbi:MAG TPA: PAS domain S-box protein [Ktedonobacteraceae bacterium]|nr:PAS domain S-box protein [Ktedonobacteraceae bacterium]